MDHYFETLATLKTCRRSISPVKARHPISSTATIVDVQFIQCMTLMGIRVVGFGSS